jgi:hypothetical protein
MGTTEVEKKAPTDSRLSSALPNLAELPVRQTREDAAAFLSRYYFKTSPRTLERAPLTWRLLNGKSHCETADLIAYGESVVGAAPAVAGGRREAKRAA